jgi:V8-like Glu-specific endopeptidase
MSKQVIPWVLLFASGFAMLLGGCNGQVSSAQSESPIIGGQNDTGDPGVVLLVATVGQGGNAMCTAEIVSPHVLMTAAHCVDPNELGGTASFQVFLGSDIQSSQANNPSLWLDVKETHYDNQFNEGHPEYGHDVGAVILSSAAPVTPIAMNRTALSPANMGQKLRLVGYGVNDGYDQTGQSAGTKRVVTTPLSDYDDQFVDFGDSSTGTCEGDSGGPAFLTINGSEVIVGVTSFGQQGCQGGSTDTRVDTVALPFIDHYVGLADPGWTPGSTTGSTGSSGTTGSSGGTTGSSGGSTGSSGGSSGGSTGSGASSCQPSVPSSCPPGYGCVMTSGIGECILGPPATQKSQSSSEDGCSMGGAATPNGSWVLFVGFALFFVQRKRFGGRAT